ncbi:class I SAM-dependent methyltransferase [Dokdonella sp.]|uniref:class I SAM-dependent methyltransferase n=1 Tax=Dokdonella sp. TaxID=2291710 RepID=UPI003C500A57
MNQLPAENPLARVKDEIREDAELARSRAGDLKVASKRPPPARPRKSEERRNSYTLGELCNSNFTTFLDQAFEALLRRKPDPAGYEAQLRLLVSGRSKTEILGNLRWSPEGRDIGVRVPWLLPKYVFAKILRIPVAGYLLDWLVSVCTLPRIVQHQRAVEVYQSARRQELGNQIQAMGEQIDLIFIELGKLGSQNPAMSARVKQLYERVEPLTEDFERISAESAELRHMVLSMNHWLSSLRKNLSALELAESEQQRKSDSLYADIATRMLESDALRPARLQLWSGRLAANLPRPAQVLDLCSGEDWIKRLVELGLDAAGVDSNREIGQRARENGHAVVVAVPLSVLARTADHSLDALTALDVGCLLGRISAAELLGEARRVLRNNAWVLFGFHGEPTSIADRLDGRPEPAIDAVLMTQALLSAGFVDVAQVRSDDGAGCVLGRVGD